MVVPKGFHFGIFLQKDKSEVYKSAFCLKSFTAGGWHFGSAMDSFASRNEVIRMKKLRDSDMVEMFSRSSGPGGQHVNKVSTAAPTQARSHIGMGG